MEEPLFESGQEYLLHIIDCNKNNQDNIFIDETKYKGVTLTVGGYILPENPKEWIQDTNNPNIYKTKVGDAEIIAIYQDKDLLALELKKKDGTDINLPSGIKLSKPIYYHGEQEILNDDKADIKSTSEFKKRYGAIMIEIGGKLNIDPNLLAAVILVESSGSGFVNGNLKIRFENHKFVAFSGNTDLFIYDKKESWKGHKWRNNVLSQWRDVHTGNQDSEYLAFKFALTLNEDAAYQSISMGMGQIMGFNYSVTGYHSAKEMYKDFNSGHKSQIKGMVAFISNYSNGKGLKALQNSDLEKFVTLYNGSGQVSTYTNMMKARMKDYINAK